MDSVSEAQLSLDLINQWSAGINSGVLHLMSVDHVHCTAIINMLAKHHCLKASILAEFCVTKVIEEKEKKAYKQKILIHFTLNLKHHPWTINYYIFDIILWW